MNRFVAVSILAAAALLEAGIRSSAISGRVCLFLLGAVVLFAYGWVVNAPPWNFGQLLGLYVVFFFVAAQLISWLVFAEPPNRFVLIGGALIVSGGLVIAVWG